MATSLTLRSVYGPSLVPVDAVIELLNEELDPRRVSEFSKLVEAAKRRDNETGERRNYWGELAIWSKRRLGQLIEQGQTEGWIRSEGRPEKCSRDVNISADDIAERMTRSRAKALAAIAEDDVRDAIAKLKEDGEVSLAALLREVKSPHVANNSGDFEWYTPPEIIERARTVLGAIDLDPCSAATPQEWIKAKRFYTAADDGLCKRWKGRVWMNPPYAANLVLEFTDKLLTHIESGSVPAAVVLVNNATDTKWWQTLVRDASAICFLAGRVKFYDRTGQPAKTPLQGQTVVYFGDEVMKFLQQFDSSGCCVEVSP